MIFCPQVDEGPGVRPAHSGVALERVGVRVARQHRREAAPERRLFRICGVPQLQVAPKPSLLDLDPDAPPELIFDYFANRYG